ncbi:sigma-54-dependent transcriptional regulator [Opitutus terrae]|uniref:Two component, sigma54 specific, transcriptional regulator, Fis family n=1 Tax=Opitutus terrae (strain DSM 11246 / JCM 15787 / PB90-1) TaxID=452637 RepID=B1ZR63_OPITP|nr:sigma-54 dependent transcriptional regulator [Opitutus terrae]ACB73727.1 two component, sigma54 specific, transcriptional regulator, Fis family [Opitutus terrae PB90-1]
MSFEKILIVEDELVVRNLLQSIFQRHKLPVTCANNLAEATAQLQREQFDLMMLDIRLPDGDGQKFLEQVAAMPERPLVVMVTGYGSVESAVGCMRAGAFDYVLKPFSPSQIDVILKKAQTYRQLLRVNRLLSDDPEDEEGILVGRSPAMIRLRQIIERVAPTDATVLITGESGTGKEMVAREFYRRSPRRSQAFIKVNCAAISENLIESEFFGHERGAFTGATERREGRFELAHQGTLLLDEVSEIPANLQAKLLRVLQEREFERVGGSRTIKVNVRIIATSNRDLMRHVEKGEFRQDLYYRLNVFPVHVPALRERPEDIALLADHFLRRFARKHGVKVTGFADSARAALIGYRWPGNVRELQNTVERAVILSETGRAVTAAALGLPGDFLPGELPLEPAPAPEVPALPVAAVAEEPAGASPTVTDSHGQVLKLDELEKQAIRAALRQTGGNRTQAAAELGISIRTLRNKLQEYRLAGDPVDADFASIDS